jgi:hypothetical protein
VEAADGGRDGADNGVCDGGGAVRETGFGARTCAKRDRRSARTREQRLRIRRKQNKDHHKIR